MIKTNIADAKSRLSEYVDRALRGEQVVICRHNQPVAELRALETARVEPRPVGPISGQPTFEVPPSFFEPLPDDELDRWEGGGGSDWSPPDPRREAVTKVAEPRARYGAGPDGRSKRRKS